jgi:hypothetical protein
MFGVAFDGRDPCRRILMPPTWDGHPLRKSHYARATEQPPFRMTVAEFEAEEAALTVDPAALGLPTARDGVELMVLNYGPHHPQPTACSASCSASTARRSSGPGPTSATTTAAPRRWPSARPGTASSPTPTASTTSAA